jgi:hypothetical protein
MPSRALSTADLTAARLVYERDGATFQSLADRHGVSERTMRRLLVAVGVEPRRPGKQLVEIASPDLVAANWACRGQLPRHRRQARSRRLQAGGSVSSGRVELTHLPAPVEPAKRRHADYPMRRYAGRS